MTQRISTSFFLLLALLVGCLLQQTSHAQCTTPINVFPYAENFENNNGSWSRSNTLHWEWGSIAPGGKNVITAAGGGQKCWIIGGFSGAFYNSGNSYLQSPCFDFSSLADPEIAFKIFWETETNFDGVNLQYSTDEGASWTILGSSNSNASCLGTNWYNLSSVRFIGFVNGWSGNVQSGGGGSCNNGSGSGQWLVAKHNMGFLAGQNKVLFRFEFGAGTICNDYEGFAIDDMLIREAPPAGADFTYSCQGNNTVSFANNSSACVTGLQWTFGDIASGINNTSTQVNPTHVFTGPGLYTVSLTATFTSGPPSTETKNIYILNVNPVITNTILCNGDQDGAITATVTGGNGIYNYSWNTNPVQTTSTITGLSSNTYTVTIAATDACSVSSSVSLVEPDPLDILIETQPATCNRQNGSITSSVRGGTSSYMYRWSNNETTAAIQDVAVGNYSLQVTDANGCSSTINNISVINQEVPALPNLGEAKTICPGQSLVLNPGTFDNYTWQDNSSNPTFTVTASGDYSVTVTNSAGCTGSDEVTITVDCIGIYFPTAFSPNGDGINESFGALGDLSLLTDFNLHIYNRWGQRVFYSTNPFVKWNGKLSGSSADLQGFVWMSSYRYQGGQILSKKGSVTIIR